MRSHSLIDATISAPLTGFVSGTTGLPLGTHALVAVADFDYGSGGATIKVWVQTSLDRGRTWFDVINFAFLLADARKISAVKLATVSAPAYVPTDATLGDDLIKDGLIGDQVRAKVTTTGTYAGNTRLRVHAAAM